MTPPPAPTAALLVIDQQGRHSIYLDRARAEQIAATRHGQVYELIVRPDSPQPHPPQTQE